MRSFIIPISLCILAVGLVYMAFADNQNKPVNTAPFRHAVFFKFKENAPKAEIVKIENAFVALEKKIDLIADFEWGTSESVENLNDGFTHCFFVTFNNKADLKAYIVHPEHKAFVKLLGDNIDNIFVFDYTAK